MLWFERFDLRVAEELPGLAYVKDEPMSRHTSFRIGGGAKRIAEEDFARNAGVASVKVTRCALGNDAGIIGAALLGR